MKGEGCRYLENCLLACPDTLDIIVAITFDLERLMMNMNAKFSLFCSLN